MSCRVGVRTAALVVAVVLALAACSSGATPPSDSSFTSVIPPDLVPPAAADAVVTVTTPGVAPVTVPPDVVRRVVPFLVRRVFDPTEPLADYGLDRPSATITFAMADRTTITLVVGGRDLDQTAYYVQRVGDTEVWLVLTDSLQPLLDAR